MAKMLDVQCQDCEIKGKLLICALHNFNVAWNPVINALLDIPFIRLLIKGGKVEVEKCKVKERMERDRLDYERYKSNSRSGKQSRHSNA